jgi:ribosomal protein S18
MAPSASEDFSSNGRLPLPASGWPVAERIEKQAISGLVGLNQRCIHEAISGLVGLNQRCIHQAISGLVGLNQRRFHQAIS